MTAPVTSFTGSIPELYDRYLGPVLFEPYARELAARLPASAVNVLEVAAGTGRLTRHLLDRVPARRVLATDLNQAMIDHGARTVIDPRVRWLVADAGRLPVSDRAFDAVACQFGLMFVPDKRAALREMRRALGAGGVLLLSTWDELAHNPASLLLHEHALATVPSDPPTFMATPFSMPDPIALRALVGEAGFETVRVETVAVMGEATSAADLAIGFVRGNPLWNQLNERGIDVTAFEREVAATLAARFGDRPCRTPMSAHVVIATV